MEEVLSLPCMKNVRHAWERQDLLHNAWERQDLLHNAWERQDLLHNAWERQDLLHNAWERQDLLHNAGERQDLLHIDNAIIIVVCIPQDSQARYKTLGYSIPKHHYCQVQGPVLHFYVFYTIYSYFCDCCIHTPTQYYA